MTRALVVLLLASSLCACERGGGRLVIEAPGRLARAAASDDAALCGRLAVDFTIDNLGDGQAPLLERAPLVESSDGPCTFELAAAAELPRGSYDVLVRFLAASGEYNGSASCAGDGVEELWIGAYVLEGIDFPNEELRFSDEAFLSLPGQETSLPEAGISFDVDGDERDNLAEVATQSDPCVENTPPVVTLAVEPASIDEEQPVTVRVSSADPAGIRHRLTLRLAHAHGPTVGTEVITYRRYTSAPVEESIAPNPETQAVRPPWDLVVESAVEDGPGSVDVTLRFVPDEPFVGSVTLTASADDGLGNTLAEAAPATLAVNDLDDPTSLLFENDEGVLEPVARVDFREVGEGTSPTVRRFKIASEDLDSDVSQWTVALASGPPGLTLAQDLSFWEVTWAPDNDDVINAPPAGYSMLLQFRDPSGNEVGDPEEYALGIAPLYNDPPSFGDLSALDLTLNAGPFATKTIPFAFHDPDRATGQPSCTAVVEPAGATTCTSAWSETRCEVNGTRSDDTWPFVVTLAPSASYFDDCGGTPQFVLELTVSDVAPAGADPSTPVTIATQDSCYGEPAGCVEHLQLYTAEMVTVTTLQGGAAAPSALSGGIELSIDGARGVAAFVASDATDERVFVVDLDTSPPSFVRTYDRTVLCSFHEGYLRVPHAVAVDEVNGRVVGFGRAGDAADDCWNTSPVVFSLSTAPPYDVVTWPLATACNNACQYYGCGGAPAADEQGNVYLPCGGDSGTLLRIDGSNQLSTRDIAGYDGSQDAWGTDVVKAGDGTSWFAWPDNAGILFVETTSWDATLHVERLTHPTEWREYWLEQGTADRWRDSYLYAYDVDKDGVALELYRVTLDSGAPALEGPLVVGDHGTSNSGDRWVRFLLKPVAAGQPSAEPDLVITGQVLSQNRLHVDLDSFTAVAGRNPEDFWYTREVFDSPDPRFYVAYVSSLTQGFEGLKLYPWDPSAPYQVQQIPGTTDWSLYYMRDWSVSYGARLTTLTESDGVVRVLRFRDE